MRTLLLIPMLLVPLTGCMTQRDKTIWAEFKAEISSQKSTELDKNEDAEAVEAPAN